MKKIRRKWPYAKNKKQKWIEIENNIRTFQLVISDNLLASTQPAVPPPIIIISEFSFKSISGLFIFSSLYKVEISNKKAQNVL